MTCTDNVYHSTTKNHYNNTCKRLVVFLHHFALPQSLILTILKDKTSGNIAVIGENTDIHHSIIFPQCFQSVTDRVPIYVTFVIMLSVWVNPLPDNKILGLPKLKAFADDKLYATQNVKMSFFQ